MITLKIKDLEQENIFIKGQDEFVYQKKIYQRKTTISKKHSDKIAEIVKQYQSDGLEIIQIEHSFYFSIWLEKKPLGDSKENLQDFVSQKLKNLGL